MHRRVIAAASLLVLLLVPAKARAQAPVQDQAFRGDIDKLLEVTGAAQMGKQAGELVTQQIFAAFKKERSDIPPRVFGVAKEVLGAELAKAFDGTDGLTSQIVAIYAKHFSHDDVKGLLAFYGSELGKKTIQVMPVLFQESAAAGQHWAEQHMPRITAAIETRLRAEGFIK